MTGMPGKPAFSELSTITGLPTAVRLPAASKPSTTSVLQTDMEGSHRHEDRQQQKNFCTSVSVICDKAKNVAV